MRWADYKNKEWIGPGDTRVVTKFLMLPKYINREWRWFEITAYEEKMVYELFNGFRWKATRWYQKGDMLPKNAIKKGLYFGIKRIFSE